MSSPSWIRRAIRTPFRVARGACDRLPATTRTHARAAATEGVAALRSLADGATDVAERAIDRVGTLASGRHGADRGQRPPDTERE